MSRANPTLPRGGSSGAGAPGRRIEPPRKKTVDYIDLEDEDDDELDELANDAVPSSSPYFTQPTQLVNRRTQPTQLINRTTQPTQILDRPSLQRASSPLVPESPSTTIEVPASSPFQAKSQAKPSNTMSLGQGITNKRVGSLMAPAGTAFKSPVARPPSPTQSKKTAGYLTVSDNQVDDDYKHAFSSEDEKPMRGEIRPSSFVKKDTARASAIKAEPQRPQEQDIRLSDIHNVRLRWLTKEVYNIVAKKMPITLRECRDALLEGVDWNVSNAVKFLVGGSNATEKPSLPPKAAQTTLKNFIHTSNSSKEHSADSSAASTGLSGGGNNNNPPRRRRLIQGRRAKSPSPTPVFSLSSSATSPSTTPLHSDTSSPASVMAIQNNRLNSKAPPAPEPANKSRRRLQQGRRAPTPPPATKPIMIDSDSDEYDDLTDRKRKATAKLEPTHTTNKKTKLFKDPSSSPEDFVAQPSGEKSPVLEYLNDCTLERLSQMTGNPQADCKTILSCRPFASLRDVQKVSRKTKNKKGKTVHDEIGADIVTKLTTFFEGLEAAGAVISMCEARGAELQSIMSSWAMDKNGRPQSGSELPLSEQPALMAEDIALKSYQLLGLNWMSLLHSKGYSGILADDMGLGKTCQVISMISHLVETYNEDEDEDATKPWPVLIVVPPSTFENWLSELDRFAPSLSVCPYYGKNRTEIDVDGAREQHVVVTTYSQVERQKADLEWLRDLEPYAAIYDEGHKLKNHNTLVYKQLQRIPTQWRLILSGTPVQNNLKELLTLLNFLEPDLFQGDTFERLQTILNTKVPNKEVHNFAALSEERITNARTIVSPFILQRRKDQVLDMAKKIERNQVVPMHPAQRAIYKEIKDRYLLPKHARESSAVKDSNPWIQLRKAAIHHQLFRVHFTDKVVQKMVDILWKNCNEEELHVQTKQERHKKALIQEFKDSSDFQLHLWCKDFQKYIGHLDIPDRSWEEGPKVAKLLEMVRGYMAAGDRCLVFSRFELVIDILRETLHSAGIPYCELTGRTNTAERFPTVQEFNENDEIPVFLLTTGAGGTGLNLTAANKIIIFDQSDNPQDDVQASNRAHRIGQTRDVEVIRLITEDSVEGLIYNSCIKKLMLAASVEGNVPDDSDQAESLEQQCRKLMLLENENEARSSQVA
ncbi:SNF2 family N-terminal domain-containing protein [Xylariaceae sp. FL0804]|nr:SNF2 family N-terminal domain-containing protein [Xylariaceae sp. FL0804]